MKQAKLQNAIALAALALLCHSGNALAQYAWIDERGIKQYSDMPPPSSVPAQRILRQPGGARLPAPVTATQAEPTQMTTAEKNAAFRKRHAEQAEKDKKAAEDAKLAADKARNCERAREYQRGLESGVRIAIAGKDGERSYLTDEQRERELQETRRVLSQCG